MNQFQQFIICANFVKQVCADEKESRKDLYIKATSYAGQLKARRSQMLKEQEFHLTTKKGQAGPETVPALPAPAGPASGANIKVESGKESESESTSRSGSREKSLTKGGGDRDKGTPDRKGRKERESKERSRERSSKVITFYYY